MRLNFKQKYEKLYPYIFTSVFLILEILLISRHELWRDEIHAFNVARESVNIGQFINFMRQSEGTPYLWHFILYLVSHFITKSVESIKIIHLVISTATSFLVLKFAPFDKFIRVLFIFGYFMFFEYSIISRNYALGILLIFIFCILYQNKWKNLLFISITVFFMSQCNIYSFFISVSLIILLFIDFFRSRQIELKKINKVLLLFSILIPLSGILLVYWQIGDQFLTNFANNQSSVSILNGYLLKLKNIPTILINSYFPVPGNGINFWNTNLFLNILLKINIIFSFLISIATVVVSVILLKIKFKILFLFNLLLMINFMILIYFGSTRHWGYVFILFFTCLWLSKKEEKKSYFYLIKWRKVLLNIFILIILTSAFAGSSVAFYYDYKYPFSNGKNVADYLKRNFNINDLLIVGYKSYTSETVAGYLNKDFYYPEEQKFTKIFNMIARKQITTEVLLSDALNLKMQNPDKEILIINYKGSELNQDLIQNYNFLFEKEFVNAIVQDENYLLYRFNNNLKFEILKRINTSNFAENFNNFKNCNYRIDNKRIIIETLNDDPNFESKFPMNWGSDYKKILIKINIEVPENTGLSIYFKYKNKNYSEKDKYGFDLTKGNNSAIIFINIADGIEKIRIDPTNARVDSIINDIEIYALN